MDGNGKPIDEEIPPWLVALLCEKFFSPCSKHDASEKNETNMFCVNCCYGICQHCRSSHASQHYLLQIRRYVYHNVVRLCDMYRLFDCSQVQAYTINSARVVFLRDRPAQKKPLKMFANACKTCHRTLKDAYSYCSISCKVDGIARGCKKRPSLSCSLPSRTEQQSSPHSVVLSSTACRGDGDVVVTSPLDRRKNQKNKINSDLLHVDEMPALGSSSRRPASRNIRKRIPHRAPLF